MNSDAVRINIGGRKALVAKHPAYRRLADLLSIQQIGRDKMSDGVESVIRYPQTLT